jgi:hypothetical protein
MPKHFGLKIVFIVLFLGLISPVFVSADSYGQKTNFYVDSEYDISGREKISATLRYIGTKSYFYIEDDWWKTLEDSQKQEILTSISNLSKEFSQKIYPELTSLFGTEWKPGIDRDNRITILFEQLKEKAGGYFNAKDEYPKIQSPFSNQREMVYLSTKYLTEPIEKSYLAHEFVHLITFNQKTRKFDKDEEVWLNEARADFAPTLLGYDKNYQGSNLQRRVREFLVNPSDSLTEWENQSEDYGVINIFVQYLVDHYGTDILADSLSLPETGIPSIEKTLKKRGIEKDFGEIFRDWLITLVLNDCSFGKEYCFLNENLKNFRITPSLIFLPSTQSTTLSLTYAIKEWSGHWYKIIGGNKGLRVEFKGIDSQNFIVSYILQGSNQPTTIHFLDFDSLGKGIIKLPDFGKDSQSLIILPFLWEKKSNFSDDEPTYRFNLSVSTLEKGQSKEELIAQLKAKILELQEKILQLQAELQKLLNKQISCQKIEKNLYYGMRDDSQVRCLQEFLRIQGEDIYPEGLVTGNFFSLTKKAVIKFQEKYREEILVPLGLKYGTGFVGPSTRKKINSLLKNP